MYGHEIKLFKLGRMPAMAVVDAEGIVRFVHYGHSMRDITANAFRSTAIGVALGRTARPSTRPPLTLVVSHQLEDS